MSDTAAGPGGRRPLTSRDTSLARGVAAWLSRTGVTPNQISVASVVAATGSGLALAWSGRLALDATWARVGLLLLGAALIQGRLACNLFDGMVAVEGKKGTPSGGVYNELPDRLADAAILVGAGYGAAFAWSGSPTLGWVAACLAILTAYVRALGASLGVGQDFGGPMAKPQRMATLTGAALLSMTEPLWWSGWPGRRGIVLTAGLAVIAVGTAWTAAARSRRLVRRLESGGSTP